MGGVRGDHCGRHHPQAGGTNGREADCQTGGRSISPISRMQVNECGAGPAECVADLDPEGYHRVHRRSWCYTTQYRETRCWRVFSGWKIENSSSPSSGGSTDPHPLHIWEDRVGSFAGHCTRGGRRAGRSAHAPWSSVWGNIADSPLQVDSRRGRGCLQILLTCVCSPARVSGVAEFKTVAVVWRGDAQLPLELQEETSPT